MTALAAHPRHRDTFYAGTRAAGVFATRDGGRTWRPANRRIETLWAFDVEVATGAPETVYATT